jgi:diadenylate cyclase
MATFSPFILFQPLSQLTRLTSYGFFEVLVELAVIWILVYWIWRFVEGTRAAGAVRGIIVVALVAMGLRLLTPVESFRRLAFLFDNILGFAALALVIIFQPELRRAVIRLGETSIFRQQTSDMAPVIDEIVEACGFLSKNSFGAIIAIERTVGLKETVEAGRFLNADVSAELLQSIFWPNNPLHDMGVVIRGGKIVAAGVQFPLAHPLEMADPQLGTRHRAAVGLTRAVDALCIVISEETGSISLAERGKLTRWLSPDDLRGELTERLAAVEEAEKEKAPDVDETLSGEKAEEQAA